VPGAADFVPTPPAVKCNAEQNMHFAIKLRIVPSFHKKSDILANEVPLFPIDHHFIKAKKKHLPTFKEHNCTLAVSHVVSYGIQQTLFVLLYCCSPEANTVVLSNVGPV